MQNFRNVLWGIVLIIIGVIIGCNAVGLTNINLFFDGWWTLFIIVPCFIGLFKENERTGNIIGLLIGALLLLGCLEVIDFDLIWKLILPIILVIIGLSFIFKDLLGKKVTKEIKKLNENKKGENSCWATFAGQNIDYNDEKFTGCDINAIFGGVKCDLRKAIIESDVVINTYSVFGGIDIYVPSNVKVKIKSMSIFGGVENKANTKTNEKSYTIYINATTLFGGVEIKK